MMRKLPDCPRCAEDELWLCRYSDSVYVGCYECGWNFTIAPRPAEDALDSAVALVVALAAAAPPAGHCHQ